MQKRVISGILALALVLTLALTLAQADVRVELDGIDGGSASVTAAEDDSAALLEGYLYQLNGLEAPETVVKAEGSGNTASRPATYAVALNAVTQEVYDRVVPELKAIAAGKRGSSVIHVENVSFTVAEISGFNIKQLMNKLLIDMPYDLYWFDKTKGVSANYAPYNDGSIAYIELTFGISKDYAVADNASSLDTAKTGAATAAAAKAAQVVAENQGKGIYSKLVAYREYITNAVDYNFGAAYTANYPYGDPWQLIYVFDGDPNTNVVCEGYSKAFKYLCDLTWTGSDPEVKCYLAVGKMDGGDHMWNIVSIGGVNYLTDITNCDSGLDDEGNQIQMIGYPDQLFLCGVRGGVDSGYIADLTGNTTTVYFYDDEMLALYDKELVLSATKYSPLAFDLNQLIALARYAAGITTDESAAIDVNKDGIISAADLTAMAQSLAS